jgi:hypothetical protein
MSRNIIFVLMYHRHKLLDLIYMLWLVYSCCFHLERRASVKRFVSLQFLNLRHSVGLLGRVVSPLQGRYLAQTQNKHKQTSMPRVGFESTIPAFERAKTVHALDRAGDSPILAIRTLLKAILVVRTGCSRLRFSWKFKFDLIAELWKCDLSDKF